MKTRLSAIFVTLVFLFAATLPSGASAGLSNIESDELQMSYALVTQEFYKKVDPQALLDGARKQMIAFLVKNGVKAPAIPAVRANEDQRVNARALEREVAGVVSAYGAKLGARQLTYEAIGGMLASVNDKYTTFLTPKQYADLNEGLDGGCFSGVGIAIRVDEKTKQLRGNDVIEGGPAEKGGIKSGDIFTAIDGKPTKGLTVEDDSKLLRGKEGTVVRISIERDGADIAPISLTRAVIHQPSVYAKMLDGNIGYARLTVFGSTTASELTKALDKLEAQHARAYVLDLRDNGGGYLNAAIEVSSKFIASGPIVSVESRGGSNTEYDAEATAIPPRPLAVLVNKFTASASEITSGAIQDNGVGELIGERTYGKGVVQSIHPLPDGSAVKITSARYLTPHGRDINLVGINPDIVSVQPKDAKYGDPTSDVQLRSAITYLQGRIARLQI
ncbi:MAG: S41 family peptidase [Candidatus Eremiobacteraeota bacterium]|nr:S41 family peptidase [Candidatus Eremiobacteraeota bacterium]